MPPELEASLNCWGCVSPILIQGDRIIDGIKRWQIMSPEQRRAAPIQVATTPAPFPARWLANATRPWNPVETALVFLALPEPDREAFCTSRQLSATANLIRSFELIAASPDLWPDLIRGALPLSIWRDLGYTGDRLAELAKLVLAAPGTVAEKRLLAGLLKQTWLKHRLPAAFTIAPATTLVAQLQQVLSPRREDVQQRLEKALKEIDLPPRVDLETDPVFEKPGITVRLHLRRNETGRLQLLQKSLEQLFERVPEL